MANIFDVAKYILSSSVTTTQGHEIPVMKLNILCYYAQAWHLTWNDTMLFTEDFKKYDYEPINTDLQGIFKDKSFIKLEDIPSNLLSSNLVLSLEETTTLTVVLKDYGSYTAKQLAEMARKEKPWIDTAKNEILSKETIKNFYLSYATDKHTTKLPLLSQIILPKNESKFGGYGGGKQNNGSLRNHIPKGKNYAFRKK